MVLQLNCVLLLYDCIIFIVFLTGKYFLKMHQIVHLKVYVLTFSRGGPSFRKRDNLLPQATPSPSARVTTCTSLNFQVWRTLGICTWWFLYALYCIFEWFVIVGNVPIFIVLCIWMICNDHKGKKIQIIYFIYLFQTLSRTHILIFCSAILNNIRMVYF